MGSRRPTLSSLAMASHFQPETLCKARSVVNSVAASAGNLSSKSSAFVATDRLSISIMASNLQTQSHSKPCLRSLSSLLLGQEFSALRNIVQSPCSSVPPVASIRYSQKPSSLAEAQILQRLGEFAHLFRSGWTGVYVGALIIRIECWKPLYYNHNKEPQK